MAGIDALLLGIAGTRQIFTKGTMMLQAVKLSIALTLVLAFAANVMARDKPTGEDKDGGTATLNVKGDGVKKMVANRTRGGFPAARVFYTLADQHAVVKIHINNKSDKFPISGTVYQFDPDVTAEGLAKWLNNQHSDGLFPDIPEPFATHKLPADSLQVVSSKVLGQIQGGIRNDTYDKYMVEFALKETKLKMDLTVAAFADSATVFVKAD